MFSVYRTDQLKRFALFWLLNYSFIFSLDVKVWIRFIYCISSDFTLFSFICLELCFKKAQRPVIILLFFQFPTVFLPVISKTKIFPKAMLGMKGNKYHITDQLFLTNIINIGYSTLCGTNRIFLWHSSASLSFDETVSVIIEYFFKKFLSKVFIIRAEQRGVLSQTFQIVKGY